MHTKTNILSVIISAPRRIWRGYRTWPFTRQLLVAGGIFALLTVLNALARPVQFSYAGNNCYDRLVILPDLQRTKGQEYQMQYGDVLRMGGIALSASSVCLTPVTAPQPRTTATVKASLLGIPLLGQSSFAVSVPELPVVNYHIVNDGIAATRLLEIPMSSTDRSFDYRLKSEDKIGTCVPKERALLCDVQSLDLKQGAKYRLSLERLFAGRPIKTLMNQEVTTLSPVSVLESSVKHGETVFTRPTNVMFKMDKQITSLSAKLERLDGEKRIITEQSVRINGPNIEISFAELPRSSHYYLTLSDVVAEDGSSLLDQSYMLPFSMSGGPKVTQVNIGRYGVASGATVVITFDQNLSSTQDIGPLVKLAGGIGNMSRVGNQLRFSTASVPLCGDFSLTIAKDIQSEHGISGDSSWSYSSRTVCHTVATIGYTVKGRAITAYRFGTGAQVILYVGAIHGNERGTYSLMSEWIDELERNARTIPADKSIIVIPAINRDGLASGGRRNANNVDLNRNFATADWKKDVTMPGGEMIVDGGGSAPLSEPESKALASYTLSLSPRLVLTYHSVGGLVTPNETGISITSASLYSQQSGYYVSPKSQASTTFEYDTTGAYEDWLYEKPGIPAILVELGSHTSSSSSRNFPAMWAMTK